MNFRDLFFALLLAAVLMGCGKQPVPRHIVILPDVSGSIDRQALHQAFKAIDELVGQLRRKYFFAGLQQIARGKASAGLANAFDE